MRVAIRIAAMLLALIVGLPLHGASRLLGRPSPWPRRFLGIVARIVGARPRVIGTPLASHVVFVANHLSWIDILLLGGATGSAFVAKAELDRVPLIGWLCRLNHTLFVERGDRMGVATQVARLREGLARGAPVTLFPEGTTGDGRALLPFKAALFGMLDPPPPGIRVQPVRIDYGDATHELAWAGGETGRAHALRVLRRRRRFVATLAFAEPFAPEGGRKAIAAEARRRIEAMGNVPPTPPVRAAIRETPMPTERTPTQKMAANARKGLDLHDRFGRGGTDVGVNRARQIADGEALSDEDVKSMHSYFARHAVDKTTHTHEWGNDADPSAGYIAWLLWGGDEGQAWADRERAALDG